MEKSLQSQINKVEKRLNYGKEQLLGKGLLMPNNPTNSGSRKILHSTQVEQIHAITNPEPPHIQTGYEDELGIFSSSYIEADDDFVLVSKINKFNGVGLENHHYFLIVYKVHKKEYHLIEVCTYQYITETFGTIFDNTNINNMVNNAQMNINNIIKKDSVIRKSASFNDLNERCDGVNLLTGYKASEYTKEDGILISESAAFKLRAPLVNMTTIQMNDNDIPLNLYGDNTIYKVIPDINEETNYGTICALRRENSEHVLFSQTYERLQTLLISDDRINGKGKIVDIDIYVNNPSILEGEYYQQLKYYYDNKNRYYKEIVDIVNQIKKNDPFAKFTDELSEMYDMGNDILNGKEYINNAKQFSNIIIDIVTIEESFLNESDKVTNRYGGKGCISKIVPDEYMPMLEDGRRLEIEYTPPSSISRSNTGLLFEQSVNFILDRMLENIKDSKESYISEYAWAEASYEVYNDIIGRISESMGKYLSVINKLLTKEKRLEIINSIIEDGHINVSVDPATEIMTLDKLESIYNDYNIEPYTVFVPIERSTGKVDMVPARRKIVASNQYIYRLKQYSEDKLSAVSISTTNMRGENAKSNSKKMKKALYSKTCIKMGNMETGNQLQLNPDVVVTNLLLNSLAPLARKSFLELLSGDTRDINIKLLEDASNRAAEIVNIKLKSIGLQLEFFEKYMPLTALYIEQMNLYVPNQGLQLFEKINPNKKEELYSKLDRFEHMYHYTEDRIYQKDNGENSLYVMCGDEDEE